MTTVFIWNNNQVTEKISKQVGYAPAAKSVIGHASMNIHDDFGTTRDRDHGYFFANTDSHVSWWPDGDGGADKSHVESTGSPNSSLFADIMIETYVPDHVIRIDHPPPAFIYRMEKEWKSQLKKSGVKGSYHFLKENCSRVTSRVLRRGFNMGRGNIKYGQAISGVWTPLMVKRLAMDIKGGSVLNIPARQMLWDEFADDLVARGAIYPKTGSLLKLLKKRASNRGSSGAAPRFDFTKEESILDRFQKAKLGKFRGDKSFPVTIILYSEARGRGQTISESVRVCQDATVQALGEKEFDSIYDSGLFKQLLLLAEEIPAAGPAPPKPARSR